MLKRIITYTLLSLVLLFIHLSYFNLSYTLNSELSLISSLVILKDYYQKDNEDRLNDFLFINTSYDKALVPYTDSTGVSGNISITDRDLLDRLFKRLDNASDPQKFIVCDIDLAIPAKKDSTYFCSLIGKENYVFPSPTIALNKEGVFCKYNPRFYPSRYSSYDGSFSKIELWNNQGSSTLPLFVYEDLNKDLIASKRSFTTSGFSPKNIYLNYFLREDDLYRNDRILTLSEAVNCSHPSNPELIKTQFADKIIFIGNMNEDRHLTLLGDMAGIVILANSFLSLENDFHILTWAKILVIFCIIFILLIIGIRFDDIKQKKYNNLWIARLVTFISYSLIATVFSALFMLCFSVYFSFLPMAILFAMYLSFSTLFRLNKKSV